MRRGLNPHIPNSDKYEVRESISVAFTGASNGVDFAHLFMDGTYKTGAQMDQENRERALQAQRLKAEEDRFPKLNQTNARLAAERNMENRIRALRDDKRMPVFARQTEKSNAILAYQTVLQDQARARAAAAEAARKAGKR